jgi:multiple antibiotic resistance protein
VRPSITHFISLFFTLLAIINPLEAIPVFLKLLQGKSHEVQRKVAQKSCLYAMMLMFFFLLFGTLLLKLFGVPLSMVRIVGGIILTRIGFELFAPKPGGGMIPTGGSEQADGEDVAFIPMAMPIMFGPGGIATIISMATTLHVSSWGGPGVESIIASCLAIIATMFTTYLSLAYAGKILKKIGPNGIDAATRITGFFVSAMGMGLIFNGIVEFLQSYGIMAGRVIAG